MTFVLCHILPELVSNKYPISLVGKGAYGDIMSVFWDLNDDKYLWERCMTRLYLIFSALYSANIPNIGAFS